MRYPNRKLSARYPTDLKAWQALKTHYRDTMRAKSLHDLFKRDKKRAQRYTLATGDLTLDYSKNHVNATTRKQLVRLAREAGVQAAIQAMFAGNAINVTEDRSVLHTALRAKMSDHGRARDRRGYRGPGRRSTRSRISSARFTWARYVAIAASV